MSGLLRRFDLALMTPPEATPAPLPSAADAALLERLQLWCRAAPGQPLVIASCDSLAAPAAAPNRALLDRLALQLDGSELLLARGGLSGLLLRLRVKLQDAGLWPVSAATAIWDAGWLRSDALAACASFRPRRPTLLLVDAAMQPRLNEALAALQAASPAYQRPLRVLVC